MIQRLMIFGLAALAVSAHAGGAPEQAGSDGDVAPGQEAELTPLTIVLDWVPNTNHTGLYVALDRGWFEEAGLDVEVVQPAETGSDALVAGGRGDFGVSHQEALTFARTSDSPLPIVAIGAILQHNTSGFAAPAARDLENPGDFAGLRFGGWGTAYEEAILEAVMEPYGADADTVEFVNIGTMDIFVAFEREIDFTWIFYGWDGIRAEVQGVELDYFPLDELDPQLDYYTPIFITREEMIEQDPEVVRSFMNAVARGYRYTAANPTEAARILRTYAPEIGEEHARRSLEYLSPFFLDEDGEWGVMQRLLWDEFTAFLDEHELLTNPLDIDAAYTNEFLPAEQ